jgi:hypothetical protein
MSEGKASSLALEASEPRSQARLREDHRQVVIQVAAGMLQEPGN